MHAGVRLSSAELPPRARRIHAYGGIEAGIEGTTSACAENTISMCGCRPTMRNYLRVRGEYQGCLKISREGGGTTSACAENTYRIGVGGDDCVNYLRVRGEYSYSTLAASRNVELPPRARRIHLIAPIGDVDHGTTSACAENTLLILMGCPITWNYLRVRGEYTICWCDAGHRWELPPRARRIHEKLLSEVCRQGTTSACAENTVVDCSGNPITRNYLRVRGEYR